MMTFNTASAISVIFEMLSEINIVVNGGASKEFAQAALDRIHELGDVLGVFQLEEEGCNRADIQASCK